MAYKILLVDDDQENLDVNSQLLSLAGYEAVTAFDGQSAIRAVKAAKKDFALVLMDYRMPGMNGAQAVAEIKAIKPHQQILAFSMDTTREAMRDNFKAGALDFVDKNIENDQLLQLIADYCVKYETLFRTVDSVVSTNCDREKFISETGMVGRSQGLFDLCKQVRQIAPSMATTLITGESGTGKELVARALHAFSARNSGPFVAINISAVAATLQDSILFGHKKGSFTGASNDQLGHFQLANKGTIFLDEVGDMSSDLQVKLLRVLQEKEIMPIGASKPVNVDVRIVAATHKNLAQLVHEGLFREDLYYRLTSLTLETIPLRDRSEDIEPLVSTFTREVCKENGFSRNFQRRCLEIFAKNPWRGNVRELRSAVERHLIRAVSGIVTVEDLDPVIYEQSLALKPSTLEQIDAHLEGIKKQMVIDAMKNCSRAEASRKLNIPQNRLNYFINKWGLDDLH